MNLESCFHSSGRTFQTFLGKCDQNARENCVECSPSFPKSSEFEPQAFKSIGTSKSPKTTKIFNSSRLCTRNIRGGLEERLEEVATSPKRTIAVEADGEHNRDFLDFLEALVTIDLADESCPLSGGNRQTRCHFIR